MMKTTSPVVVTTEEEIRRMIEQAARQAARQAADETARRMMPSIGKVRPPHVTQKDAAEMVGVSRSTISKMIEHGTFRLNDFGLIPIEQIDAALMGRAA